MRMDSLLPKILDMSLTAGIVIILVLGARLLLKRAPKVFSYALWAVVLFRLVCPVSFSAHFSLFGLFPAPTSKTVGSAYSSMSYIPADVVYTAPRQESLPAPGGAAADSNTLPKGEARTSGDRLKGWVEAATVLWLAGIAGMLAYSAVSLIRLRRKLIGAGHLRDNIYLADHLASPFVIGVLRPKIYLPSSLPEEEWSYVILHEQTHIRRLDHLVKMLAYLALAVHWFNPLVWVAFVCAVKDMEMSCDERVLKLMGGDIRSAYGASLLSLATGRRFINGSPLAFGEGNLKGRIKNVMNFKKPAAWVVVVSVLLIVALSVGLAANGIVERHDPGDDKALFKERFAEARKVGLHYTATKCMGPDAKPAFSIDSAQYYKCSHYTSKAELRAATEAVFTDNGARGFFTRFDYDAFVDRDGSLYIAPWYLFDASPWRAEDTISFQGKTVDTFLWDSLKVSQVEDSKISYTLDWYYSYPDNPSTVVFTLVRGTDGVWRFDECFGNPVSAAPSETHIVSAAEPGKNAFVTGWDNAKANGAADMSADESKAWQKKLLKDMPEAGSDEVGGIYSKDFDNNGKKDLVVLLRAAGSQSTQAYLCVYMNDDPIYKKAFDGTLTSFAFMQYPFSGDIDNDGCPEIVYNVFTGGNGGAGSSVKGVLKYKNHALVPMTLPGDNFEPFSDNNDVGYQVKVLFGSGENEYRAVCSGLGKTVDFKAQNAVNDDGTKFRPYTKENEEVGANCRGYSGFSLVNRNGRNCLFAEEYLYGEAGISHGVGFATFLIDWDGGGTPSVSEFGVSDKSVLSRTESADPSDAKELIAQADVNQDGKDENIYLDKSQMEKTFDVTIFVTDQNGNELWHETLNTAHAGWNQIFLCSLDGKSYLLRYNPGMYQGYCTYVYSLFSPQAGGKEKVHQTKTLEFDINGNKEFDARKMTDFADEVNALLKKSTLLASSDGGAWSFGPASAEPFYERYSWLDGSHELFSDGDSLEAKLEKYSDWAIKNRNLRN